MNKRQIILIVIVIAIGALLGALILTWNKAATPEAAHGGHDKSDLSHAAHDNHDHGDHDKAPIAITMTIKINCLLFINAPCS